MIFECFDVRLREKTNESVKKITHTQEEREKERGGGCRERGNNAMLNFVSTNFQSYSKP